MVPNPELHPDAWYWVGRYRLRKQFGLSAAEADAEPLDEMRINARISELDVERAELDNVRDNQQQSTT